VAVTSKEPPNDTALFYSNGNYHQPQFYVLIHCRNKEDF